MLAGGGSNLSQGQRQLITIARIILADRPVLILDEATSSVDTRTEQKLQEALTAMMKGRTSFVIAHRLSTIRDADVIVAINEGRVVDVGSHDELMAAERLLPRPLHEPVPRRRKAGRALSDAAVQTAPEERPRGLSVRDATVLGVGSMIGAGIFALLGEAGAIAGSAVWISFLIGGVVAGLLGYGETAIAEAARPSLGDAGFTIMAVAALLATAGCTNATLYASGNLTGKLAE